MTDKEQQTLAYLEGMLLGMSGKYPIEYAQMKERINVKRDVWSTKLINAIDEKLKQYEDGLNGS